MVKPPVVKDENGEDQYAVQHWRKASTTKIIENDGSPQKKKVSEIAEERLAWIRLCQRKIVPGLTQFKVRVTTGMTGIVVIEPKQLSRTKLRVANGISEIRAN